ncbi:MAG: DUF898 family protein [Pseudomonadota bacterium]
MTDVPVPNETTRPPQISASDRGFLMRFAEQRKVLFNLALRSMLLTIVTLGIYRFWMITKLRRHYFGAIHISGDPLEYTGKPLEKLLGFLVAIVILAVYLGLVNLMLTFVGLSLANDDPVLSIAGLYLTLFATLPLIFYAQYRSTHYILSRTRWRGIRFGLVPGAWGYTWRGLLWTGLTIITLGLANPYAHFKLAKYVTDRARFGDQSFEQGGRWTMLFGPWMLIYAFMIPMGLGAFLQEAMLPGGPLLTVIGLVGIYFAIFRYQFIAFKKLWSEKRLGGATFESHLSPLNAIAILLTGVLVTIVVVIGLSIVGFILVQGVNTAFDLERLMEISTAQDSVEAIAALLDNLPSILILLAIYFTAIAVLFAVGQVYFTLRILARKVETMQIHNAISLAEAHQRGRDEAGEAGGFADALGVDVGAGF